MRTRERLQDPDDVSTVSFRFGGQTLTEQLGRYERCNQCKRSTANRGESNVFRDTNYVSGARLML